MAKLHEATLRENFMFFQRSIGKYIDEHRGRYALVHSRSVVEFFDKPIEAANAGARQFPEGSYSVQKVSDRPADLGFLADGAGSRDPN